MAFNKDSLTNKITIEIWIIFICNLSFSSFVYFVCVIFLVIISFVVIRLDADFYEWEFEAFMQSHYCSDASKNLNSDENNLQAPILDRGLLYLKSLRQANVRFAVVFFILFSFYFLFSFLLSFFGFFSLFCLPVQCNLCGMAPGARSFFLNSYFKQVMHIFVIIVIIYLCFEHFSLVVSLKKRSTFSFIDSSHCCHLSEN